MLAVSEWCRRRLAFCEAFFVASGGGLAGNRRYNVQPEPGWHLHGLESGADANQWRANVAANGPHRQLRGLFVVSGARLELGLAGRARREVGLEATYATEL